MDEDEPLEEVVAAARAAGKGYRGLRRLARIVGHLPRVCFTTWGPSDDPYLSSLIRVIATADTEEEKERTRAQIAALAIPREKAIIRVLFVQEEDEES